MTRLFVHVHIFYPDKWPEIKARLGSIQGVDYDLYVTAVREEIELFNDVRAFKPHARVEVVANKGYDVGAFMHALRQIDLGLYDYVIKLHSKRDVAKGALLKEYPVGGKVWRHLCFSFLETPEAFARCLRGFEADPSLGLAANHRLIVRSKPEVKLELKDGMALMARMGLPPKRGAFVAGTMFMVRARLLAPLLALGVDIGDFTVPVRGEKTSLAHVLERVFGWMIEAQGFRVYDCFTDRREQNWTLATCVFRAICHFFFRYKVTRKGRCIVKVCKIPVYIEPKGKRKCSS